MKDQPFRLKDFQRARLFACVCVARHIHAASDTGESLDKDVYHTTLDLLEPHLAQLDFKERPTYESVEEVWKQFVRKELAAIPTTKTTTSKTPKRNLKTLNANTQSDGATRKGSDSTTTSFNYILSLTTIIFCLCLIPYFAFDSSAQEPRNNYKNSRDREPTPRLDIRNIANRGFSQLLTPKQLKTIQVRLDVMHKDVSMLMLLGRSRDTSCQVDSTYCLAMAIANGTTNSYVDSQDSGLTTEILIASMSQQLDQERGVVVVDRLNKLPGHQVMNLFQFIDKDEEKRRRGLLLMLVYADSHDESQRAADVVEQSLFKQWSLHIPKDTLRSVISRISATVVKLY